MAGVLCAAACGVRIPNGVFACVSATDCPTGYSCWNSDGRCHDSDEPEVTCEPSTCEQVIGQFDSLGVVVECGVLPDGCDGTVECPPCGDGETCGANDMNFMCGCEGASCSSVEAQCGPIAVGCGLDEVVDCGQCPGTLTCVDNRCECTSGNCKCPQGCEDGQICVEGECCTPLFPCSANECSPPGGLPDGCGGTVKCPPCDANEQCTPNIELGRFECVGECSCESQGIECDTANVCGETQFCGSCETTPETPLCEKGRCVCEDGYEPNDTRSSAHASSCNGGCSALNLQAEIEATLDGKSDVDFYRFEVLHRQDYAFRVDVSGLQSARQLLMTYLCPDGSERVLDCSGSSSSFGSDTYCIEDGQDTLRLVHYCEGNGGEGTLIVGVSAKEGEFGGTCDRYSLTVSSFFFEFDD